MNNFFYSLKKKEKEKIPNKRNLKMRAKEEQTNLHTARMIQVENEVVEELDQDIIQAQTHFRDLIFWKTFNSF